MDTTDQIQLSGLKRWGMVQQRGACVLHARSLHGERPSVCVGSLSARRTHVFTCVSHVTYQDRTAFMRRQHPPVEVCCLTQAAPRGCRSLRRAPARRLRAARSRRTLPAALVVLCAAAPLTEWVCVRRVAPAHVTERRACAVGAEASRVKQRVRRCLCIYTHTHTCTCKTLSTHMDPSAYRHKHMVLHTSLHNGCVDRREHACACALIKC